MLLNTKKLNQSSLRRTLPWGLLILVITFVVYLPVLQNDFLKTWDDDRYIIDNPHIKDLDAKGFVDLFSLYYDGHYHPLTLVSLAVDYKIGELSPQTYHITNIVLHLFNTLLVFGFVFLLLKRRKPFVALFTALFFGIATMNVESVAWASERKNLLYTFFFFASLISYVIYTQRGKNRFYLLAIAFFVLSALSKAMAVSLCVSLIAIDYFYDRQLLSKKVILEKIPFFIVAFIFAIVAIFAQKTNWGENLGQDYHSFFERILFASNAFVLYIVKLVIPFKLSGFYPYPTVISGLYVFQSIVFLIISIAIAGCMVYFYKKSKTLVFGLAFFIINIFLLLKLFEVPAGDYFMADRYAYIPSVGLFFLIATGMKYLSEKKSLYKRVIQVFLVVYVLFISLQTFNRSTVWKDDISFYTNIISNYPDARVAYTNRGAIRKEKGQLQGALADFTKSIQLGAKSYKGYANRGAVYTALGDFNKALPDYKKAYSLNPKNPQVMSGFGYAQLQTGDYNGAIKTFNRAIQAQPENPEAYSNRGTAKYNLGNLIGAIQDYNIAIQQQPDYLNALFNRGLAKIHSGKPQESIDDFLAVLEINPNYVEAYSNMGIAWSRLGNSEKAFVNYDKAIAIDPNYFEAYLNRGIDRYYAKAFDEAIVDLNKVLELNNRVGAAYYFRAMILLNSDRNAACNDFQSAIQLGFTMASQLARTYCK